MRSEKEKIIIDWCGKKLTFWRYPKDKVVVGHLDIVVVHTYEEPLYIQKCYQLTGRAYRRGWKYLV